MKEAMTVVVQPGSNKTVVRQSDHLYCLNYYSSGVKQVAAGSNDTMRSKCDHLYQPYHYSGVGDLFDADCRVE